MPFNANASFSPEKNIVIKELEDYEEANDFSFRQANEMRPLTEAIDLGLLPRAQRFLSIDVDGDGAEPRESVQSKKSLETKIDTRGGARDI